MPKSNELSALWIMLIIWAIWILSVIVLFTGVIYIILHFAMKYW